MLVYAVPLGGSILFVRFATALTGVPTSSLWVFLAWWFGLSLAATVVVSFAYSASRRLLPLGALLELSLVFPDEAPSRFRLALRSGTVAELEERLSRMRERDEAVDVQEAAEILLQLVSALDVHDRITRGHAERVRAYAYSLGKQLDLTDHELDLLNWAALLHDIGKLSVSKEILNKPGRPTEAEWAQLRLHPLNGELLVEPIRGWLGEWTGAVGYHHERWDGKGYPRGVAGEEIPLGGRIVAIADVFDVITSTRSYKEPSTAAEARAEIARCSGEEFDPRLVRAFVAMSLGRMRMVVGPLSWLAHAPLLARLPAIPSLGAAIGGTAVLAAAATTGSASPPPTAHTPALRAAPAHASSPTQQSVVLVRSGLRRGTAIATTPHPPAHAPKVATNHPAGPHRPTATATPAATTTPSGPSSPAAVDTPATNPTGATPAPSSPPKTSPPKASPTDPAPTPPKTSPPANTPTTPAGTQPPATAPPPPPVQVNHAPSFTAGASQTTLEDAGPQSSNWASSISAGPGAESAQNVSFSTSADNTALFAAQPAVTPDGTLTYTPAPNANGVATITVTAHDSGGTSNGGTDTGAPYTFTITIQSVNDAPSFNTGANQSVVSLLGAQTVGSWATAISPGPADEAGQSVSFAVTVSNPGLFSVQPAVGPNGTLTYKPKALALGTATVTVRAVDDGGTGNGGQNTSAARTFTISIL